jgi:putative Holliday junction resolvase
MPLRLDGEIGPAAKVVEAFVQLLAPALSVPIVTWDERMTTCAAEDLLIAADVSRRKRKGIVDRIAASILLQSYLASLEETAASPPDEDLNQFEGSEPVSLDKKRADDANEIDQGTDSGRRDSRRSRGVSDSTLGSKSGR